MKPEKNPYENQKEVYDKFLEFISPFLKGEEIEEAYLWGSLADGTFGRYVEEYHNRLVSDVDLVIFLKKDASIPKTWKNLRDYHSWFDVYKNKKFRKFEYSGSHHPVDLLVAHKDRSIKDLEKDNAKVNKKFRKLK